MLSIFIDVHAKRAWLLLARGPRTRCAPTPQTQNLRAAIVSAGKNYV